MSGSEVSASVKLVGRYAERIEAEAQERGVSRPALIADYAMRGMDAAQSVEDVEARAMERRLSATLLAIRGEVERLQESVDRLVAHLGLEAADGGSNV
ncbi:hypothetical protein ACSSZE_12990 [Acidithiobacillus caldus]